MKTRRFVVPPLVLAFAFLAHADPVIMDSPESPVVTPLQRDAAAQNGISPEASAPETTPFAWGSYSLAPHILYRALYATGLQSSPGRQLDSYVQSFSPGLTLDVGTHLTVDYTPTWTYYSNRQFRNTFDQSAKLAAAWSLQDWEIAFAQSYISSHSPLIETGRQTYQKIYATDLDLVHHFNGNMAAETVLAQTTRIVAPPPNSYDWMLTEWLHYIFTSGIDVAVGTSVGYTIVHPGIDMEYLQPEVRASLPFGRKLSFDVHAGIEERKFLSHPATRLATPIFGGLARYRPFDGTTFTLGADRTVTASYFAGQVTQGTNWNARLEQRLYQHFLFSVGGDYMKSRYLSASTQAVAGRGDSRTSCDARLSTSFFRRGTVAVFYQHTKNSSNQPGYSFASNQVGVEIGYKY